MLISEPNGNTAPRIKNAECFAPELIFIYSLYSEIFFCWVKLVWKIDLIILL